MIFKFSQEELSPAIILQINNKAKNCYDMVNNGNLPKISAGSASNWSAYTEAIKKISLESSMNPDISSYFSIAIKKEKTKSDFEDIKNSYNSYKNQFESWASTFSNDIKIWKDYIYSDKKKAQSIKNSDLIYKIISISKGEKPGQAKTDKSWAKISKELINNVYNLTTNEILRNLLILDFFTNYIFGLFYDSISNVGFVYGSSRGSSSSNSGSIFGSDPEKNINRISLSPNKPKASKLNQEFIINIVVTKSWGKIITKTVSSKLGLENEIKDKAQMNVNKSILKDYSSLFILASSDEKLSSWIENQTGAFISITKGREPIITLKTRECPPSSYSGKLGAIDISYVVGSPADDFVTAKINRCQNIIKEAIGEAPLYVCTHKGKKYYYTPTQLVANGGKIKGPRGWFKPKGGKPASLHNLNKKKKGK